MVAGTVKFRLFDVIVLHKVIMETVPMHTVQMNSIKQGRYFWSSKIVKSILMTGQ